MNSDTAITAANMTGAKISEVKTPKRWRQNELCHFSRLYYASSTAEYYRKISNIRLMI